MHLHTYTLMDKLMSLLEYGRHHRYESGDDAASSKSPIQGYRGIGFPAIASWQCWCNEKDCATAAEQYAARGNASNEAWLAILISTRLRNEGYV